MTTALLTVDIVVISKIDNTVLTITRKGEPFKGKKALPGGFVNDGETVEDAALRELEEETGAKLTADDLWTIGAYTAPGRDPRGRVVSIAFLALVDKVTPVAGDDAATAEMSDIMGTPWSDYAFDHGEIIQDALLLKSSIRIPDPTFIDEGPFH